MLANNLGEYYPCMKLWMSVLVNGVETAIKPITEKMIKTK